MGNVFINPQGAQDAIRTLEGDNNAYNEEYLAIQADLTSLEQATKGAYTGRVADWTKEATAAANSMAESIRALNIEVQRNINNHMEADKLFASKG